MVLRGRGGVLSVMAGLSTGSVAHYNRSMEIEIRSSCAPVFQSSIDKFRELKSGRKSKERVARE
jgi:hypothetical protein